MSNRVTQPSSRLLGLSSGNAARSRDDRAKPGKDRLRRGTEVIR